MGHEASLAGHGINGIAGLLLKAKIRRFQALQMR
jgi:hypothetical protein